MTDLTMITMVATSLENVVETQPMQSSLMCAGKPPRHIVFSSVRGPRAYQPMNPAP